MHVHIAGANIHSICLPVLPSLSHSLSLFPNFTLSLSLSDCKYFVCVVALSLRLVHALTLSLSYFLSIVHTPSADQSLSFDFNNNFISMCHPPPRPTHLQFLSPTHKHTFPPAFLSLSLSLSAYTHTPPLSDLFFRSLSRAFFNPPTPPSSVSFCSCYSLSFAWYISCSFS